MAASEFDIHTHTIASGHASTATITDMAKAAASRNLKLLGISDRSEHSGRERQSGSGGSDPRTS